MRVGIAEGTGCCTHREEATGVCLTAGYPQGGRAGNPSGGRLAPADEALEFAPQKCMDVAFDLGPGEVPAGV